jgi:putative addiction module CopG family antidote
MPYQFPPDLQEMIASRLARGEYQSEEDVLRSALQALEQCEDDLSAVQEAIASWRAGDEGIPLAEAFQAVRETSSSKPPA